MSPPPPAAKPTSNRSCLDGNDCARPAAGSRPAAAADRINDRRYMKRSLPLSRTSAKTSSIAFIWLPAAEDGTMIGVCTPASRQAATPSRTFAAGPNSVLSASHLSVRYFGTSSRRPSAIAFSMASISST